MGNQLKTKKGEGADGCAGRNVSQVTLVRWAMAVERPPIRSLQYILLINYPGADEFVEYRENLSGCRFWGCKFSFLTLHPIIY